MESVEVVTCGVPGHDDDCLCDVVIPSVTPIRKDAVQGMWMGQEICDANGYENWDDDQEILNYLCDVLFLYDCHHFQQQYCDSNQETIKPRVSDGVIHPSARIRVTVREAMSTGRKPIGQVLAEHGLTAEEFTRAVSQGHWEMDGPTLAEFEAYIHNPKHTLGGIERKFGLGDGPAKRLRAYWPLRPTNIPKRGAGNHPYQRRMRELVTQGCANKDVVRIIKDEFGIDITTSAVTQVKRRMKIDIEAGIRWYSSKGTKGDS